MVGPDYRKPEVQVPEGFKEGVDWHRAEANPQAAISSTWWRMYGDDKLNGLVEKSLQANQSIASAEAAYRVALATVESQRGRPVSGCHGRRIRCAFWRQHCRARSEFRFDRGGGQQRPCQRERQLELDLWGQISARSRQAKANAQVIGCAACRERISITPVS